MFNEDTDILFPPRVIPRLRDLRGHFWLDLVCRIEKLPLKNQERAAFVLLMTRLAGCITCSADSYRAMRGCTQCAIQTVRRFRGNDEELVESFSSACEDIEEFIKRSNYIIDDRK